MYCTVLSVRPVGIGEGSVLSLLPESYSTVSRPVGNVQYSSGIVYGLALEMAWMEAT